MGRKHKSDTTRRSDDAFDISTDSEVLRDFIKKSSVIPGPLVTPTIPKPLRLLEDRRTFHPDPTPPAGAVQRSHRRLVLPKPAQSKTHPRSALPVLARQVGFAVPGKVAVCIRRKTRRQVLFANKSTKAGARSRRRRTEWSDVKC